MISRIRNEKLNSAEESFEDFIADVHDFGNYAEDALENFIEEYFKN